MIDRLETGLCAVCARREAGIGIQTHPKLRHSPFLWVCDDPDCLKIVTETARMRQDEFDRVESLAAVRGGDEAGQFLDQIGKSDMAKLTRAEWCEFCRRLVAGYRKALKTNLSNNGR